MSSHWPAVPWRSFSGRGEISPPAAKVPSMAEGQMIASASAELAAGQSFPAGATSNSDPVCARHSPRSRPMAVAMAGSSTTTRRSFVPANCCRSRRTAYCLPSSPRRHSRRSVRWPKGGWPEQLSSSCSGCHAHACVGMRLHVRDMPTQAWAWRSNVVKNALGSSQGDLGASVPDAWHSLRPRRPKVRQLGPSAAGKTDVRPPTFAAVESPLESRLGQRISGKSKEETASWPHYWASTSALPA